MTQNEALMANLTEASRIAKTGFNVGRLADNHTHFPLYDNHASLGNFATKSLIFLARLRRHRCDRQHYSR